MKVNDLIRGDVVRAKQHLDVEGANVKPGTDGVVFEIAGATGAGFGPMVRWATGTMCNIYEGDVETEW